MTHAFRTHWSRMSASSSEIWKTFATYSTVTPPGRATMSASSVASSEFPCKPLRAVTSSNLSRSSSRPLAAASSARSSNVSSASASARSRFSTSRALSFWSCSGLSPAASSSRPVLACKPGSSSRLMSASASDHCLRASCALQRRQIAFTFSGSTRTASSRSSTARRQNSIFISACPRLLCSTERTTSTSFMSFTCMGLPSA
mmetsp:Transcript_9643/g.32033  ORF Transcript_9643/g.32033 Transcript_9643/m.32033 type:complete len:202 (+) Transcript_9643:208-813(+)